MAEQPVVEVRGISKHFGEGPTRVDALREVSLDVYPGTVIGLRGPSGSGKSTLLNVIGCILEPSSGSMRLNGELVYDSKWLRADLRSLRLEKIGFIFQSHNLLPFLNAWENVAVARILAEASPAQAKSRALELLTYLGIERRGDAMPGELSGGEAQRVAIARALANDPRIILADEPTAALEFATCRHGHGHVEESRDGTPNRRHCSHPRREDFRSIRSHLFAAGWSARSAHTRGRPLQIDHDVIAFDRYGERLRHVRPLHHARSRLNVHRIGPGAKALSGRNRIVRCGCRIPSRARGSG